MLVTIPFFNKSKACLLGQLLSHQILYSQIIKNRWNLLSRCQLLYFVFLRQACWHIQFLVFKKFILIQDFIQSPNLFAFRHLRCSHKKIFPKFTQFHFLIVLQSNNPPIHQFTKLLANRPNHWPSWQANLNQSDLPISFYLPLSTQVITLQCPNQLLIKVKDYT